MNIFYDKFNVIQKIIIKEDYDYDEQIINFFENYIKLEINILHPEYLNQLFINNKFENIDKLIINIFKNHLNNIKINIKNLIKKDMYTIETGINKLLSNYLNKINYIYNIFKINKELYYNLFFDIIISDQIFIIFIENEISLYIQDFKKYNFLSTYKNDNKLYQNFLNIKVFLINLKLLNLYNNNNNIWFLKLIGNVIKNNIPYIKENIIMKESYNIKIITNYIFTTKEYFNFLNEEIIYLIEPLNEILVNEIINLSKNENNFDEFYYFIKLKWKNIYSIINLLHSNYIYMIKSEFSLKINKYIKNVTGSYNEISKLLEIIILLNENGFIESQLYLLFNDYKIYNNLLLFINNNYIDNIKLVTQLLLCLNNLKEKDKFIQDYYNELIKRLLSNKVNIINENLLSLFIIKIFGEKETKKILNCINDYDSSLKLLYNFNNNNKYNLNILVTSYNSWNINYNNGYLDYDINDNNFELLNIMNEYNEYYKKNNNNNKKLIWLLQFGEIEIEYNNYQIKLFPIQLLILELFDFSESYSIEDIKNNTMFKYYLTEYLDNIIKSLEISGILKNNNNILYLSDIIFETNFIQVYYNYINNIFKIEPLHFQEDLTYSRRDIICTLINQSLKKSSKNLNELFNSINENIKLFQLDNHLLNNSLEYMINHDYINLVDDKYNKLYF